MAVVDNKKASTVLRIHSPRLQVFLLLKFRARFFRVPSSSPNDGVIVI